MTTTQNLGMQLLVAGQLQPEATVNEDLNILDSVIGSLPAAFGNNPSTTSLLTYGYYGAALYLGGVLTTIPNGTISLTASATNYVQRTVAGVVSVNTTGYTTGLIPMATVVTNATTWTTITDTRPAGYDLTGRVVVQVGAPVGLAVATATTGGTLAASTEYAYRISVVYPWGESAASAEVAVTTGSTTATNENTLTWDALPTGATSAKIYGRTAGGELLIANVAAGTLTYTDTGSVTPAGALPTGTLTLLPQQYSFGMLSFQGVLSDNTSVIFPSPAQRWQVSNDTTGSYALGVMTSGGVGPTIPQGQARPIYSNGTNLAEDNTSPFGTDPLTTTGLTWGYYGGNVRNDNVVTNVPAGTVTLTASATNYVQINPAGGAMTVNQTGFTSGLIPIATLVTSATGITSYTDERASILDGPGVSVNVANIWTAEQTFDAPITQTPGQGANNSTPFLNYGDVFSDAIMSGLTTTTSSTLSGTLAAGDAYVIGQRVVYPGGNYTVAASSTSYLDLSNTGQLTVTTSSTVTANSLRLWTVTSDASAITGVEQVAPSGVVANAPVSGPAGTSGNQFVNYTQIMNGGLSPRFSFIQRGSQQHSQNWLPNSTFLYQYAGWDTPFSGLSIGNSVNATYLVYNSTNTAEQIYYSRRIGGGGLIVPYFTVALTGWVYNASTSGPASIGVACFDSTGANLGTVALSSLASGNGWTLLSTSGQLLPETSYVKVALGMQGDSAANSVAFSELKFELGPTPTPWSDDASSTLFVNGELSPIFGAIACSSSATLNGTTAGTVVSSMPAQGVMKKFGAYASGYENDTTTAQTITFPTAFANPPTITTNKTGLSLSASTTALTINAPNNTTAYTGLIIVEGF